MSSVPRSLRGGAKYGICSHLKPPYLRWDPHEVCVACTASPKMESAMIDFVHGGVPTCRYCRQISREDGKRWIDNFREYWAAFTMLYLIYGAAPYIKSDAPYFDFEV